MAIATHIEDDLDGGLADETVQFSLDGVVYEIDLNKRNAKFLRDALKEFIAKARQPADLNPKPAGAHRRAPAKKTAKKATAARPARSGPDSKAIREWAKNANVEVPMRGKVPADIVKQYLAAQ